MTRGWVGLSAKGPWWESWLLRLQAGWPGLSSGGKEQVPGAGRTQRWPEPDPWHFVGLCNPVLGRVWCRAAACRSVMMGLWGPAGVFRSLRVRLHRTAYGLSKLAAPCPVSCGCCGPRWAQPTWGRW